MKLQEVKAIAKRRGIGPGRMRKDELTKAPKRVGGNMMFWSEPSLQRNRFEFVQDGHEITVFDSAGKEG
jgi:hypothetical protein